MRKKNNELKWDPELFRQHYEKLYFTVDIVKDQEERKLEFYLENLKLKSTDILLDAGCGYGRFSKLIIDRVKSVIGIDVNPENVAYAKDYVGPEKFEVKVVDLSKGVLPFNDNAFDKIVLDNVLTFFDLNTQRKLLKEFRRVLKPKGVFVFNFDNSKYIFDFFSGVFNSFYSLKAKLTNKKIPNRYHGSIDFYKKELSQLGFSVSFTGDTFYRKLNVGKFEMFPAFLHKRIMRFDRTHHNRPAMKKMASLNVAAVLE